MTPIAFHVSAFLQDYLPKQKGASPHTSDAYSYCFQLLFVFAASSLKIDPCQICIEQLDHRMVTGFLEDLETGRGCKANTRNARLAAIKSFFHFLEFRVPRVLNQIRQVLAIPSKKTDSKLVSYLSLAETQAILQGPDLQSRMGIRDYAMIQLAVTAGLRVSELLGLHLQDLTLQPKAPEASILVRGKGRKERVLPLDKQTTKILRKWLSVRGHCDVPELFVNAKDEQMTRWGFAYILKKYVKKASDQCPSLKDKQVSPHVLRHTCAMVIMAATHDIRKVSLWLGHSSTQTTEVYVRADPSKKQDAIDAITPPRARKGRFKIPDKLLGILNASKLGGANVQKKGGHQPVQGCHSP